MKKLLLALTATFGLTVMATAAEHIFTPTSVSPAEGEVTQLQKITVQWDHCYDVDIDNKSFMYVTYNGTKLTTGVTISEDRDDDPIIYCTFNPVLTEPGEYKFIIEDDALEFYFGNNYKDSENNPDTFTFTWTIAGEDPEPTINFDEWTVDPANTSTVSSLQTIALTFPNLASLDINSADDITATCNGASVAGMTASAEANVLTLTFADAVTAAGTYAITIAEGAICGFNDDFSEFLDNPEAIALTYTIKTPHDFSYVATPAEGEVEELSLIKVNFPQCYDVDINTKNGIYVTYNGEKLTTGVTIYEDKDDDPILYAKFNPTLTAPGVYKFVIEPEAVECYFGNNYKDPEDNPSIIEVTYTIVDANNESTLNFNDWTVDPAAGEVADLTTIKVTFPNVVSLDINSADDITVTKVTEDGNVDMDATAAVDGNVLTITMDVNEPAAARVALPSNTYNYQVNIAVGALCGFNEDYSDFLDNPEAITIAYTVVDNSLHQNLTLALSSPTNPNADGEISANKALTSFFFYSEYSGLDVAELTDNVTVTGPEDYSETATLKKAFGTNSEYTYFAADFGEVEPSINGEYTITIAANSFGNAAWLENPETGYTNGLITLTFTLVDGQAAITLVGEDAAVAPAVIYNLMGQRINASLSELPAGIYIVNGKKVVK